MLTRWAQARHGARHCTTLTILPSPAENGDMILGARTAASLGIGQPLLLTHPNSEFDRANGTLLMSTTAGTSWEELLQYSHGCHASSQLVQFKDGTVGVLFDDGGPFPAGYNPMKGDCKMKIQQIVGMNETMVQTKGQNERAYISCAIYTVVYTRRVQAVVHELTWG
jgi:hypothetical protein